MKSLTGLFALPFIALGIISGFIYASVGAGFNLILEKLYEQAQKK